MGIKEKLQDQKEKRELRRELKQRMAQASIRRMQAEQAAREKKFHWYMASSGNTSAEKEHFAEVAKNLKGLDDHLLMVTNFGPSDHQAEKIAAALRQAAVPLDIPIGVSTHEHEDLDLHYEGSAYALVDALRKEGYVGAPSYGQVAGLYTETGNFSWSLRCGAKSTADWYSKPPQELLHVAVVSSLDTGEVGIPKKISIDGTAHLYRGTVSETGLPVWKQIADSQRFDY